MLSLSLLPPEMYLCIINLTVLAMFLHSIFAVHCQVDLVDLPYSGVVRNFERRVLGRPSVALDKFENFISFS